MKSTDITIILDRSGSMASTKKDAIGGFNEFLEAQQKLEGEATLTLVQFDDQYEVVYSNRPIKEVLPLTDTTYVPRGGTALVDAIGRTLNVTEARLKKFKKAERPNAIIVIITDGEENSSREFTHEVINTHIAKLKKKDWQIMFIGANQDAIKTGSRFGIAAGQTLTYTANGVGTKAVFDSFNDKIATYRTMAVSGQMYSMSFDDTDRKTQAEAA